jgi:type I restriction enzyme, S subunit
MPKDWPETTLGEVLTERQETPDPTEIDSGAIPIVSKIGFNDGKIELRRDGKTRTGMISIRPGDLVLSGINALKGAIAIYDRSAKAPIAATIHYSAYVPNEDRVDVQYLWWLLRSDYFHERLASFLPGGIKSELKAKRFLPIPVPLPPLVEQRRIVERIEGLARRVEEARGLRWEAEYDTSDILGSEIIRIFSDGKTKEWKSYKLGDLVVEMCYGTSAKAHEQLYGIPVIRMGNIQDGRLDLRDLKYMYPSENELGKLILHFGDILINRTNSAELVGKCAVFDLPGDFLFASYIIRVRLNQEIANPFLIAQYINSPIGRSYMFNERKQMTGQANVNSKKLANLPISLPSLDEQHLIVAYLDTLQAQVEELRRFQAETQKELEAVMPSILNRAFKGEL